MQLVADRGKFIARGLYNPQSNIRVRLYSWQPDVPVDEKLFSERLDAAIRLRRDRLEVDRRGVRLPDGLQRSGRALRTGGRTI